MDLHDETQALEFDDSDLEGEGTAEKKNVSRGSLSGFSSETKGQKIKFTICGHLPWVPEVLIRLRGSLSSEERATKRTSGGTGWESHFHVAHLKVFSQQGLQESLLPIFEGDNFIGRQKCEVIIPVKAMSKRHACIEVHGDLHLVHDCESKNKTRKEKAFLKPLVRYEIKHGDMLTFADIRCQYIVGDDLAEEMPKESGSETGSESMFPNDISKDQELNLDQRIVYAGSGDKPLSNKSGDEPSDDLQPTQSYLNSKQDKDEAAEAYAADTESDTDEGTPPPPQAPKTAVPCDSDGHSSGTAIGKNASAGSTLLQKMEESEHLSEDIRPVVPAILYSSDEEMQSNSDINPQDKWTRSCSTSDHDESAAADKFKEPQPTLLCESDDDKPEMSPVKFKRPMVFDSSTDEDSLLVVKPKFASSDASGDDGPPTPTHSSSSRDSRRSSMGLAPTLILSPETEEIPSDPDAAVDEGPREAPPASPQESDPERQEREDGSEPAVETTDPEATQAYMLSGDEETDDEDQVHNENQTSDKEHRDDSEHATKPHIVGGNEQTVPNELEATQAYGADVTSDSDDENNADTAKKVSISGTEPFEVDGNADGTNQQAVIINSEDKAQASAEGDHETDNENNVSQSTSALPSEEQGVEAAEATVDYGLEATQAYMGYEHSEGSSPIIEQGKAGMEEEMHAEDQPTVAYGVDETQAYGIDEPNSSEPIQLAGELEESDPCEATQAYGIDATMSTDEEQETDDEEFGDSSKSKEDQTEVTVERTVKFVPETQDSPAATSEQLSPVVPVVGVSQSAEDSEEESIGRRPQRKTRQKPLIVEFQEDAPDAQVEAETTEEPAKPKRATRGRGKRQQKSTMTTAKEESVTVVKETPPTGKRRRRGRAAAQAAEETLPAEEENVAEPPGIIQREGKRSQVTGRSAEEAVGLEASIVARETPAVSKRKGRGHRTAVESTVEETPYVSGRKGQRRQEESLVDETPSKVGRKGKRCQASEESLVEESLIISATEESVSVAESPELEVEDVETDTPAPGRPRRSGRGRKVQETKPTLIIESQARKGRGRRGQKLADQEASGTTEAGCSDSTPELKVGTIRGENSQGEETTTLEAEASEAPQTNRGGRKRKSRVEDTKGKTQAAQDVDDSQTRKTRGKGKQVRKTESPVMADSPPLSEASEPNESMEISQEATTLSASSGRQKSKGKRLRPTIEESFSETPEVGEEPPEVQPDVQGTSGQKGRGRRGKATKKTPDNSQDVIQATPAKKSKNPVVSAESPSLTEQSSEAESIPRVMFTGLVDIQSEMIVKNLGGVLVERVHDCTHLVTDKVRRTVKFLCGLGGGQKILQPSWLEACKKANAFVDPGPFLVKDKAAEKQFDFSLQRSHEVAQEKGLLDGYKIHVTKSVKPEPAQMKDIIQCAKGQFLSTLPKASDEGVIVISCEQDRTSCRGAIAAGIPVCSAELLLSGILKQELNIEEHQLFTVKTEDSQESQGGRAKSKRGESAASPAAPNASVTKTTKRKRR